MQKAILKVVTNIRTKLPEIHEFINQISEEYCGQDNKRYLICSANRKKLFSIQLQARFENLLLPYYNEIRKIRADAAELAETTAKSKYRGQER